MLFTIAQDTANAYYVPDMFAEMTDAVAKCTIFLLMSRRPTNKTGPNVLDDGIVQARKVSF